MKPRKLMRTFFVTLLVSVIALTSYTAVSASAEVEVPTTPTTGEYANSTTVDTRGDFQFAYYNEYTEFDQMQEELEAFAAEVSNGYASVLTGVFVPDVFALQVEQQPNGNAAYVTSTDNLLTQFAMTSQYGTTGLLAHNHLAGRYFYDFEIGSEGYLVFGDGSTVHFRITKMEEFQALSPTSPYSNFVNLVTQETLTSTELFYHVYKHENTVVFQTCIARDGISSWGRIFVSAEIIS